MILKGSYTRVAMISQGVDLIQISDFLFLNMNAFRRNLIVLFMAMADSFVASFVSAAETSRERLLMDFGWKFHLGNEWGIAQNLAKAGTGYGPASTSLPSAKARW